METVKSPYSTCSGPSMNPTLKPGDGLEILTYGNRSEICVGDVIVYPHPLGTVDVVHRIIEVRHDGVITRGDNNRIDPYTVRFEDITGKVIAAKRKNQRVPIIRDYQEQLILVSGSRLIGRQLPESGSGRSGSPINTSSTKAGFKKARLKEQIES